MSKILQGRRNAGAGSSKYIGVYKTRTCNRWTCCIKINKKKFRKNFLTEREAAIAYDKLALYFYRDAAKTNFNIRYPLEELESFFYNLSNRIFYSKPRSIGKGNYPYIHYLKRLDRWQGIYRCKNFITIRTKLYLQELDAYKELCELFKNEKTVPNIIRDGFLNLDQV